MTPPAPQSILRGSAGSSARPLRPGLLNLEEERVVDTTAEDRAAAVARGYAEGQASAAREQARALAELKAEHEAAFTLAIAALAEAERQSRAAWQAQLDTVQHEATELAFGIVEALLARELELASDPGKEAIERALSRSTEDGPATVRLNPRDYFFLGEQPVIGRDLEVLTDESIEAGGALVEIGQVVLDSRIGPALTRLRVLLGLEEPAR